MLREGCFNFKHKQTFFIFILLVSSTRIIVSNASNSRWNVFSRQLTTQKTSTPSTTSCEETPTICEALHHLGHPVTGVCAQSDSDTITCECAQGASHPIGEPHDCIQPPCVPNPCDSSTSICKVKSDTDYSCECLDGYVHGDTSRVCILSHPCDIGTHTCPKNISTCVPDKGVLFHCSCNKGYENPKNDVTTCIDIDECQTNIHECNLISTVCINTVGSYHCNCLSGFERLQSDSQTQCSDINECITGHSCNLDTSECVNTIGDYKCNCLKGYRPIQSTKKCEDIDECADKTDTCNKDTSICINTIGSYRCDCKKGYRSSGSLHQCIDINECKENTDTCDHSISDCFNTPGNYRCDCHEGYRSSLTAHYMCEDIDECKEKKDNCNTSSTTCVNTIGSFRCECKDGYRTSSLSSTTCDDIDECKENTDTCDHSISDCFNTPGSYRCDCHSGYRQSISQVHVCEDIDECKEKTDTCDKSNSVCSNTIGDFTCDCLPGYHHIGNNLKTCEDIDECTSETPNPCERIEIQENQHLLVPNSVIPGGGCQNVPGSYICTCNTGFSHPQSDTTTCQDIDECLTSTHVCNLQNSQCLNIRGDYECDCNWGFHLEPPPDPTKPSRICIDIDECLEGLQANKNVLACNPVSSLCSNSYGSYNCNCYGGYRNTITPEKLKNGCSTEECCKDIDECAEQTHGCSDVCESGVVVPPLNYTCSCHDERFLYDSRSCDYCAYDDWQPWGDCNVTCNYGSFNRTRNVAKGFGDNSPMCWDIRNTMSFTACMRPPCTNGDCELSAWSVWGPCSVTVGYGVERQTRIIQKGQDKCQGEVLERTRECFVEEKHESLLENISWPQIGMAGGFGALVIAGAGLCCYQYSKRRAAPEYM